MNKPAVAAQPQVENWDPIWSQVRREAEEVSAAEPALGGFLYASILSHSRFEDAVIHRLAHRLQHAVLDPGLIHKPFLEILNEDPTLGEEFRADAMAWIQRDPACDRLIEPLIYFKGYHALQTHRIGHHRRGDVHPAHRFAQTLSQGRSRLRAILRVLAEPTDVRSGVKRRST